MLALNFLRIILFISFSLSLTSASVMFLVLEPVDDADSLLKPLANADSLLKPLANADSLLKPLANAD